MAERDSNKMMWLAAGALGLAAWALVNKWREENIEGQVVLVAGGSRGLGLLLAHEFAKEGCRVAFCARDPKELLRAQNELADARFPVYPVTCDVSDKEQVDRMIEDVTAALGPVDILVNCAGIMEVGPIQSLDLTNFERAMNVMFWGPLYGILAVLPQMLARRRGRIVNITSIGGKLSFPHLLPYSAAKFALMGLSEGLGAELSGQGVRVTTIVPGFMRTGSYQNAYFTGQAEKEFQWFALGASLPLVSMDARRAARQIVRATKRSASEMILSIPANLAARFHGLFPELTEDLLGLVNLLLPGPGRNQHFSRGGDIQERVNSKLFQAATQLGKGAAATYQRQVLEE